MFSQAAPVRRFAAVRFVRAEDGSSYAPVYHVPDDDGKIFSRVIIILSFLTERFRREHRAHSFGKFERRTNYLPKECG